MADDLPGTPGARSIGGEPLSEAGDDGGSSNNSGGDNGGGGGGGSGDGGHDDVTGGEFTREEVLRSIETGKSLEEVNTPADAAGEDEESSSSSSGSGTSNSGSSNQSGESANLATGGGAVSQQNTGPAGVPKSPSESSGSSGSSDTTDSTDAFERRTSTDGTPNLPGNPNLDRTQVPEWVRPDRNPRGSIDTSAGPGVAAGQFAYQEARDLERAPEGVPAAGLTGDEIRAQIALRDALRSNTNREGAEQADAQTNPNSFRPGRDTTQEQAQAAREQRRQLKEDLTSKPGIDSSEVDSGFRYTDRGVEIYAEPTARGVRDYQRSRAKNQLEQKIEDRYGVDAKPGEDFTVSRSGGEFVANLTDQYERSVAQSRRRALREARQKLPEGSPLRSGGLQSGEGRADLVFDDIPSGGVETPQQRMPIQATQAPESFSRASDRGPTDMGSVSIPTTGITVDPEVRRKIESGLENKTGTDLSREDYRVLPTDQGYRASLTEKGKEQVEVSNTPLKDVPVVGGVLTTGTRTRQEIRDATDPFANWWKKRTPSKKDIWSAAAAGAPIAVGEPTPAGEAVLATLVGGTLLTDAAVRSRDTVLGEDPQASTSVRGSEIEQPTGPQDRSELETPDERAGQGQGTSEMQVPDNQQSRSELEVPEEETTVQPEELGVPRDAVQSGEVDITGPEGTQITDEGDIVIPARTTQVAREKRYEEEQKEEEEEEDKQNDEEGNQQNEDEVVVEVPEELLPDEEVTIGEPEQPAEEEEEAGQSEEDVPSKPRDYQGVDDAVPEDTISEEEFVGPEVSDGEFVSDQASVIDVGLGIGAGAVTSPPGERTVPATGGREDALDLLDEVLNVGMGEQQEEATDATSDLASEVTQTPTVDQQPRLRGQLDQVLKQALSTQTRTTQQTQQQQQRTQTQQQFDTPYEYQTTTTKRRKKREESEEKKGSNGSEDSESNLVVGDRRLDIGWLNETVADIATRQGAVGISPSQRKLRGEPESVQLTGQRATSLALSGSRSQQQRVAAVKDFLSFGVAGDEASDGRGRADPLADRRQQPPARESGIGALAGGDQSGGDDRDQNGLGLDLVGGSSSNGDGENPLSVDIDLF